MKFMLPLCGRRNNPTIRAPCPGCPTHHSAHHDRPTHACVSQHNACDASQRGSLVVQVEKATWSHVSLVLRDPSLSIQMGLEQMFVREAVEWTLGRAVLPGRTALCLPITVCSLLLTWPRSWED